MPFPIRLRPQVEDEVQEAMAWYQDRRSGLDLDFYRSFLDILGLIAASPRLYRTVYGEVRRVIFRRFPYVLFYIFADGEVIVLACVHERRSPDRWPDRADT